MVTTTLMIIGGFSLIIILVLVGFQLLGADRLKLKVGPHSIELEVSRAPADQQPPPKRPAKRLPKRR